MPATTTKLGPGTLTIGETLTLLDVSCQVVNAQLAWEKSAEDDIRTLCDDVVPGAVTYTATLSGTLLQDLANASGVVAYSYAHKGETVPFIFTPNTAAGAKVEGDVTIDPLTVGSTEDVGANMTSDFEWDCVGEPTFTPGTGTMAAAAEPEPAGL